jgi:hypothetical protein
MLAQQKDLLTGRWRNIPLPEPSEVELQIAVMRHLRLRRARSDVLFWHTPNGGQRDKRTGALLKAMGALPGVPDLIFIWPPGQILFLELKTAKGRLAPNQAEFGSMAMKAGAHYEVARGLDEALEILQKHGLIR